MSKTQGSDSSRLKVDRIEPQEELKLDQLFSGMDQAQPHHRGQPVLLSVLIHVLTSSRNTLIDIPRMMLCQPSGHPMAQSS
jgi:hypothetical protein